MRAIFGKAHYRTTLITMALILAVLLFAPDGSAEGVVAPGGQNVAAVSADQSNADFSVQGPSELSVHENTFIGESIANYRVVTGGGADVSGTEFAFSLEGDDAAKYTIDPRSGELFTASWLDYETDVTDAITVVASDQTSRTTLDVTVNIVNVEDSVSTIQISKANPVPGAYQGNPEHALDSGYPANFVETEWANWGTILRIVARRESPDPDCGTGLSCITVRLEADESGDVQRLKAMRSGERGDEYLAAVILRESESERGLVVEIEGATGEVRPVHVLAVNEDDDVSIAFDNLRSSVEMENEPPEFGDLEFEQELAFGGVDAEFSLEVTDAGSWLPEPEDLPDNDRDSKYMPVVGLAHDSQCYSSDSAGESLQAVDGIAVNGGSIYCNGVPEFRLIRDDRDFEEVDDGFSIETTLVLDQDSTYFVTFIACDNAGNCAVYDADEDSDALLLRVDTLGEVPADPCLTPITGDVIISDGWDGSCLSDREPEPYGGDGARYARYYTFTLDESSDVTITLTSDEDTYMYLLEGAGKEGTELYQNDDIVPSQNLNSRIEETLGPGQYTIEATTYYSGTTGEFTLDVSGIGEAPAEIDCSSGIAVDDPDGNAGLVSDCEVLLAVRDELAGTATLNWSADIPMNGWEGTGIAGSPERVDSLTLNRYGLSGVIPAELGGLPELRELSLDGNNLTGRIPTELGQLRKLWGLSLGDNRLSGEIPGELGRITLLLDLFLNGNELTGGIPPELGNLRHLEYLHLQGNRLDGRIPVELGNLENIYSLNLSGNELTGCVPGALREVVDNDFSDLGLPFCDDSGVTPPPPSETCAVDMGDFDTRLEIIDDRWEEECESVNRPDDGDYYALFYTFDLDEEADVTVTLESEEDAYVYLLEGEGEEGLVLFEDDDTDGTNPRIRTTLQAGSYTVEATTYEIGVEGDFRIGVETEELNGRPPVTCIIDMDRTLSHSAQIYEIDLDSACKSVSRPDDREYYAHYATLQLKFPADVTITLGSDEDAYLYLLDGDGVTGRALYEDDDTEGTNSRIEASLQPGTYTIESTTYEEGVTGLFWVEVRVASTSRELCSEGRAIPDPDSNPMLLGDCAILLDAKYVLSAEPPLNWSADLPMEEWEGVTLGGSPLRVTGLQLSGRGLTGQVPLEFDYLWGLEELVLTDNTLTGDVLHLGDSMNLRFLELGSNKISGEIPVEGSEPSQLEVLYLYDNKLSGEIPVELGGLQNLAALAFHGNRLSGEIPRELGKLSNLDKMHLTNNRLVGNIPDELADIPNLYGLFLAGNNLTGCIPHGLRDVEENDFDELGLPFCPPPFTDACIETLPSVSSLAIEDTWNADCPSVNSPSGAPYYARYYAFNLNERTPIEIELTAEGDRGSYLFLLVGEGSRGGILRADGREGGSATIAATLEPGSYTIETTTYQPETTGNFRLEVRMLHDATTQCTSGVAVPVPDVNTDLVEKCVALLHVGFWLEAEVPLNWKSDKPIYEWEGLTFEDTIGALTELKLSNRGLMGRIPPELGNMTKLQVLDLQRNSLSGEIPPELGSLTELEELNFSINSLSGSIPPELGDLSNLRILSLAINRLSGEIPRELGRLANLEVLWLAGCANLSGPIPIELGELTKLRALDVAGNALTGEIPAELGKLSHLERLGLGRNALHGDIPEELADLSSLRDLYLYNNNLTGHIPKGLSGLQSLRAMQLQRNHLTGEIPAELSKLGELEELILEGNFLSGHIPASIGDLNRLKILDLTNNRLTGELPSSLGKLANLEKLSIGGCNGLTGQIPVELARLTSLKELLLYSNSLVGEIPKELADLPELRNLWLYGNNLTGEIPPELGQISHLETLALGFNELEGEIPSDIGNLKELRLLLLEENILTGQIPKSLAYLEKLEYSDFRRNELTGCIPFGMRGVVETDPVLPECAAP